MDLYETLSAMTVPELRRLLIQKDVDFKYHDLKKTLIETLINNEQQGDEADTVDSSADGSSSSSENEVRGICSLIPHRNTNALHQEPATLNSSIPMPTSREDERRLQKANIEKESPESREHAILAERHLKAAEAAMMMSLKASLLSLSYNRGAQDNIKLRQKCRDQAATISELESVLRAAGIAILTREQAKCSRMGDDTLEASMDNEPSV